MSTFKNTIFYKLFYGNYRKSKIIIFIVSLLFCSSVMYGGTKTPSIITYPAPEGELPSTDFKTQVNDKDIFVYQARVSAIPVNQVYIGYQRSKEQTEIASFAYFDFSGQVSVKVTSNIIIKSVDIRPKSYGITPIVDGNVIRFNLSRPCKIVIEVNGWHNALHIFANDIEKNIPNLDSPNLRYFGPGIHQEEIIKMRDNEILYIAGGSIVHGVIEAKDISNIKILGRGILDAGLISRESAGNMISLFNCSNILIDGIILRDSPSWAIIPRNCKDVKISDVKLIGFWRYNSDGIDICNTENAVISNCFIRAFDDNIAIKGLQDQKYPDRRQQNVRNIEVSDCVLWNDWGRPLEIGVETNADSVGKIVFKDCDIIHFVHVALDIQNGERAIIHDVKFENIRIEEPIIHNAEISDYNNNYKHKYDPIELGKLIEMNIRKTIISQDPKRGKIFNISFKNIIYEGSSYPQSVFEGFDDKHMIENITFEDIFINGKRINNLSEFNIHLNNFTKNILFK